MTLRIDTITTTTVRTPTPGPWRWWLLIVGAIVTLTLLTWGFAWSVERATKEASMSALHDAGLGSVTVSDVSYRDVTLTGPAADQDAAVAAVAALGLTSDVTYLSAGASPAQAEPSVTPTPAATATPSASTATATASPSPSASPAPVVLPDLPDLRGIQFETGSATLTAASLPVLDQAAGAISDALASRPGLHVSIEGHTDSDGDDAANLTLSQQRAQAVSDYLVGHGVPAASLSATGYGETKPIQDNATADGRAANRRVDFVITDN